MENLQRSGLDCFQELLKQKRLAPDWDGIVNDKMLEAYDENSLDALFKIAEAMEYHPEICNIFEAENVTSPAITLLKNNEYVCVINPAQLQTEKVALFNPRGKNGPATVMIPTAQFKEITDGKAVIFHNLLSMK